MPLDGNESYHSDDEDLLLPDRMTSSRHNLRRRVLKLENILQILKWLILVGMICVVLRYLPQLEKERRNRKNILIWNDKPEKAYFSRPWWPETECGCVVTRNHNMDIKFNAIVINADNPYTLAGLERVSKSERHFLVYAQSKPFSDATIPAGQDTLPKFNLTMTYRNDSNIIWQDYQILPKRSDDTESQFSEPDFNFAFTFSRREWIDLELILEAKTRLIVYNIFEVSPQTRAKSVMLEELHNYINLDAYATCSEYTDCIPYKFFLILEPTRCPNYVNPEFYVALSKYMVPVVLGGANFTGLVPPHSYINGADFPSLLALTQYLLHLDRNYNDYLKYFWWHARYKIRHNCQQYCTLCKILQNPDAVRHFAGVEHNFNAWWSNHKCLNATFDMKLTKKRQLLYLH